MSDAFTRKSRLGYKYDLIDALRCNPTVIQAGDDICAVAADAITALEAKVAELEAMLTDYLTAPYLAGLAKGRAEALDEAAKVAKAQAERMPDYVMRGPDGTWLPGSPYDQGYCEGALASEAAILALKEKPNG